MHDFKYSDGELFCENVALARIAAEVGTPVYVYAGIGKKAGEMVSALEAGILMFNVESLTELETLNQVAGEIGKVADIALRVNPDVDPDTHPYIATGLKEAKFGINIEQALAIYERADSLPNIRIVGVHQHIGSQITSVEPFQDSLSKL